MRRTSRTLLGITTALGTVAATVVVSTSTANAAACDPSRVAPSGSLIGDLWRSNGGERSVYGCPVTKEYGYAGKRGSYQEFQNGKIVWSPNLGDGALVRAYYAGGKAVFRWSGLGRDWDFFQVRWSSNTAGSRTTQVKVGRLTPWSGAYDGLSRVTAVPSEEDSARPLDGREGTPAPVSSPWRSAGSGVAERQTCKQLGRLAMPLDGVCREGYVMPD